MDKNDTQSSPDTGTGPPSSDPEKQDDKEPAKTALNESCKSTKTANLSMVHSNVKSLPTTSDKLTTSTTSNQSSLQRNPADKTEKELPTKSINKSHSQNLGPMNAASHLIKKSASSKKRRLNLKEFIQRHFLRGSTAMEYELWELNTLITMAKNVFEAGPSLVECDAPVFVCGDIHGQYADLLRIFYACGPPGKVRYLFLGDYVDRGRHSLEVISLLLACKIRYPRQIFLLRGNHEVKKINNVYGFKTELQRRFKDITDWSPLYDSFNDMFAEMPLAALVSGNILCMHGGISPRLNSLNDIRNIQRPIHVLPRGLIQDLLWSDPELNISGFQPNLQRQASVLFGEDAVYDKLKKLNIQLIIRAHQVVEFGYGFFANERVITVFSAPRYYDDVANWGAVVHVDADLECTFKVFKPLEYKCRDMSKKREETVDGDEDEIDRTGLQATPPSAAQVAIIKAFTRD